MEVELDDDVNEKKGARERNPVNPNEYPKLDDEIPAPQHQEEIAFLDKEPVAAGIAVATNLPTSGGSKTAEELLDEEKRAYKDFSESTSYTAAAVNMSDKFQPVADIYKPKYDGLLAKIAQANEDPIRAQPPRRQLLVPAIITKNGMIRVCSQELCQTSAREHEKLAALQGKSLIGTSVFAALNYADSKGYIEV